MTIYDYSRKQAEKGIENDQTNFRQMLREYVLMFSGAYLPQILVFLIFFAVGLTIFLFERHTGEFTGFMVIFEFAAAWMLFAVTPFAVLWFLSPLFARVVLPFTIGVLEYVRLFVRFAQESLDETITLITKSDIYPRNKP